MDLAKKENLNVDFGDLVKIAENVIYDNDVMR